MTICGDITRYEKFFRGEVEHHRIKEIYDRFLPIVQECEGKNTKSCQNLRNDFSIYKRSVEGYKEVKKAKKKICGKRGSFDCAKYRDSIEVMDDEMIKYSPYFIDIPPARKSLSKTVKSYRRVLEKKCPAEFEKYNVPKSFPKLDTPLSQDLKDIPKMFEAYRQSKIREKMRPEWELQPFLSQDEVKAWKKIYNLMESKNEHFHLGIQPINKQTVIDMDIKTDGGYKEVACFFHVPYNSVGYNSKGKKSKDIIYNLSDPQQFEISTKLLSKDLLNQNVKKSSQGWITKDNSIRFRQSKKANGLCFRFIL